LVVATSVVATASEISIRSTSVVAGAPELTNPSDKTQTLVPIYELVGFNARKLEVKGFDQVSVVLDAWGSVLPSGATLSGDVSLAYVDGLTFDRHLELRLGRQLLVGGTTRMLELDGLMAQVQAPYGLGLSAFVGQPVARRFSNFTHGDLATGGRLFWGPSTDAQVGISLTHVDDRGALVRQDVGLDGRWYLRRAVTLTGALLYSLAEQRLAEFDGGVRWQPWRDLELFAGYRRTAPDLFLARNSIFSVFADTTRDEVGGSLSYQLTRALSLTGDGHAVWLNLEQGYDLGLRAVAQPFRSNATQLTAHVRRLSVPVNGYTQGRLGARHRLPVGLTLFADFDLYGLDVAVRGRRTSFSYSAGATYAAMHNLLFGLSVMGGATPYYERHTEIMAKVTYTFEKSGS
jgi:hypothetical protein